MATKEVLGELSANKRPVKFDAGDSRDEILNLKKAFDRFSDKGLTAASVLAFEIKSERWQGQWIDLLEGDEIPDGSCLKVSIRNEVCLNIKYPTTCKFIWLICDRPLYNIYTVAITCRSISRGHPS